MFETIVIGNWGSIASIGGAVYSVIASVIQGRQSGQILEVLRQGVATPVELGPERLYVPELVRTEDTTRSAQHVLCDTDKARQQIRGLEDLLSRGRAIMTSLVQTPARLQDAMRKDPSKVLTAIEPLLPEEEIEPRAGHVPVVYWRDGRRFVGWQTERNLRGHFDCAFHANVEAWLARESGRFNRRLRFRPRYALSEVEARDEIRRVDLFEANWNSRPVPSGAQYLVLSTRYRTDLIRDLTTRLTWIKDGCDWVSSAAANDYISDLRREKAGGYSDWRLPTVEEALSLIQYERANGAVLDPVFGEPRGDVWTADRLSSTHQWSSDLLHGECSTDSIQDGIHGVRAVR